MTPGEMCREIAATAITAATAAATTADQMQIDFQTRDQSDFRTLWTHHFFKLYI